MATTTAFTNTLKLGLAVADYDFTLTTGHACKIALIKSTPTGTYGVATTNYSDVTGNTDETTGTGYTAGGAALTNITPQVTSNVAHWQFNGPVTWTTATFTASAALFYNTDATAGTANRAISTHDFAGDKTSSGGDFTVNMPTNDNTTGLLRLA